MDPQPAPYLNDPSPAPFVQDREDNGQFAPVSHDQFGRPISHLDADDLLD